MHARSRRRNFAAPWLPTSRLFEFWGLASLAMFAGCGQQPEIRSYDVPRDSKALTESADEPTRMIATIVLRGSQAWFIKTTGPKAAVDDVADDLHQFVRSLETPGDKPDAIGWKVPEGWTDGGPRPMREATLALPDRGVPVEVAISKLSYDGKQDSYLLRNINRWRGQLGLDPVASLDDADAGVTTIDVADTTAWVFDAVGTGPGGMQSPAMKPPAMAGNRPLPASHPEVPASASSSNPPAAPAAAIAKPIVQFQPGKDWKELPRGSMGSRSYQINSDGGPVVVKLSDFPPVGMMADPLQNINRWRRLLGKPPLEEQQLEEASEPIDVDGTEGVLANIESPDAEKAMTAVMVTKHNHVWFFQLTGTPDGVAALQDDFLSWLGNVKIVQPGTDPPEGKQPDAEETQADKEGA